MSPSPLPGVSPLVAISKSSSSSQSPLHHQQSSQHNLPIPSTSYNLTPPLNNIPKLSNTIIKQQQQNLFLNSPKMIVQNDKNLDISDSSSIGSNINKISNIPDITAKEISSLEESILLNSSNNNNNIVNNNNNNNNDELNDDKNQLISDIKIKKENNDKKNSSNTINDNKDKQQENDKDESNNNKKEDEKSIITFDVSKKREIFLKNLNKHIICNLCQGYLIDATTIVECLHSFCHSCIMKHLRTEQYCPRCEMMINTAKPNIKTTPHETLEPTVSTDIITNEEISIIDTNQYLDKATSTNSLQESTTKALEKPDTTLQAIVYKIVPGLYEKELMRKRAFYRDRPKDAAKATPEQRGEDTEHLIFSPTENMSLSLEYADLTEIPSSSDDIYGLNTPKYLQCPASLTVAHLKKFVLMKFAIDSELFMVEIMYKVKTIVLYDHYTLMDVAYIYTWKRDAPMRFFFRVKETDNYAIKLDKLKRRNPVIKNEININNNSTSLATNNINCSSTTTNDDPKLQNFEKSKIKIEPQEINKLAYDMNKKFEIVQSPKSTNSSETQKTEKIKITLVGKNKYPKITSPNNQDKLIKNDLQQQQKPIKSIKNSELIYHQKITTNNNYGSNNVEQQPERKPENIKMKIDISKQDSIKIINMSGPDSMPKEIVKSVKPEKEWKIKIKKEDKHSLTNPKTSPKDSDNKRQRKNNLSPLTVPPITIKAEKLSPIQKSYIKSLSPSSSKSKDKTSSSKIVIGEKDEEEKKSEFLNSFALTPIKNISPEKYIKNKTNNLPEIKVVPTKNLMGPPLKPVAVSKRKTKEPIKSTNSKKPKFDFADILTPENFTKKRIEKEQQIVKQQPKEMISFGLSPYPIGGNNSNNNNNNNSNNNTNSNTNTNNNCDVLINGKPLHKFNNDDKLMPAPPPLKALDTIKKNGIKKPQNNNDNNKNMKFPMTTNKQHNKLLQNNRNQHHIAQPGSTTPHPMIPSGIASSKAAMAATPGNRTPITTKRYPSILPKHQSIINPFANIPNEVNKILQDSGTEIKHITPNEDGSNSIKVYGPSMNIPSSSTQKLPINQPQQMPTTNNINKNTSINKTSTNNHSYLNYALYNASKTRGNEVPPGCRTPMYTPNSPIYSPNSPQYIPNYNIPIQPTYKYAPKSAATTNVNSYLQNVLGQNKQMSGLFPGPPVKKSDDNNMIMKKSVSPTTTPTTNNNFETDAKKLNQNENNNKLNYPPFSKTPPNNEKTNKNEPEKQIKVKSLLNSCNINIPSSLSITITNEDNDSKSNNSLNPKHKSPVNNYIEILKLPDQTLQEQIIEQQQQQQQQQQQNQVKDETTTPTKKKDNELSNISSTTCNNTKKNSSGNTKTVMTMNTPRSSPMPFINSTTKTITSPTTNTCTPTSTPPIITAPPIITTNKLIPSEKKLTETPKKSPIETPKENKSIGNTKIGQNIDKNNTINKKTPSPDKKSPSPINDTKKRPNSDKKSSPENGTKSIKTDITQQQPPTKKFRHILPRAPIATQSQNISNNKQNIQSSTNLPKPNTKNLQIQQQQQQLSQQNQKPSQNIVGGIRTNFPNTSNGCIIGVKTNQQISTNKNNNNNNNLKKNDGNFLNALMKSPITSIQQQQSPHSINLNNNNSMIDNSLQQTVSSSSNNIQRPNSTDMANFFNETILRAAAVNAANVAAVNNSNNGNNSGGPQSNTSSNIFLPQLAAAAAANFGQFAPINFNPYNFQQAIVLEQYARYKAGQDALEKFAQNLKNSNNNANKNNSNSPKGSILNGSSSNNNNNAVSDGVTGSTGTK